MPACLVETVLTSSQRRILEKKKKTATRERNEIEYPNGIPLEDPRGVWIMGR